MTKTKKGWKVPFREGVFLRYAINDPNSRHCAGPERSGWREYADEWRDNYEFVATMRFVTFKRGRSAAYAIWETEDGEQYSMFLTDLEDAIPYMVDGHLTIRRFTFSKRGSNYGVKLA